MTERPDVPRPSPEVEQLVLFGRIEEAVALYAKQADVDQGTAQQVVAELADSQ